MGVSSYFYRLPLLKSGSSRTCTQSCCYAARAYSASKKTSSSFLAVKIFASLGSWRSACSHWPDLPPVETETPPKDFSFGVIQIYSVSIEKARRDHQLGRFPLAFQFFSIRTMSLWPLFRLGPLSFPSPVQV